GAPISPFYYSNGGGLTGDSVEVWGQKIDYIASMSSPDEGAAAGKLNWYRVVLTDGTVGYIRSDYADDTGMKSPAGLPIAAANETGVAIRPAPYVDNVKNEAIAKVNKGDRMTIIGRDLESNEYAWIRGPFTGSKLLELINNTIPTPVAGQLQSLEISKLGPSGRVTELMANGKPIPLTRPDNYRTALNGAPSTKFQIEQTAQMNILGADGKQRQLNGTQGSVYVLSGESASSTPKPLQTAKSTYYLMNAAGAVRPVTQDPQFRLIGNGFGHGLGMSQWGARGLAESGYDYRYILQYYYSGVTISKE
ncbi:MAG: stage sporulation protein SpoIID, partial [Paenibacillus sp.]|nr:stage sporulation protein SpoIID [Paenibacillus sp.]